MMLTSCLQSALVLVTYYISAACGVSTYYCNHGAAESVYISNGTARIVTRRSGSNSYGNNLACFWDVSTDIGKRLHFKVIQSDLQYAPDNANCHSYDNVAFKEDTIMDDYNWSGAELGMYFTWCGDMNPRYFSSKDSSVHLEFHSNDRNTYTYSGVMVEVTVFDANDCPPEWLQETSRQTEFCYKLRSHKETWADAQLYCNKEHSNLVSFADETEADFVTGIIENATGFDRHDRVWIGLNDITANSQYKWIDEIQTTVLYRWRDSPHSADVYDSCVSVQYNDGKWQEEYCTLSDIQTVTKNTFVCKTKKGGTVTLHRVPPDNMDKAGKGGDVPVIGIVLGTVFGAVLVSTCLALCVYCCCCKNPDGGDSNQSMNREATTVSVGGVRLKETNTRRSRGNELQCPPSYQDVVSGNA